MSINYLKWCTLKLNSPSIGCPHVPPLGYRRNFGSVGRPPNTLFGSVGRPPNTLGVVFLRLVRRLSWFRLLSAAPRVSVVVDPTFRE